MNTRKNSKHTPTILILLALGLSIISLFIEQAGIRNTSVFYITNIMDFTVLILLIWEIVSDFRKSGYPLLYVRNNLVSLSFAAVFIILFAVNKYIIFINEVSSADQYSLSVIILRNMFLILKIVTRFKKIALFVRNLTVHPAQTIIFSFLMVILVGTLLLMMPFTAVNSRGLPFLDALFTATSAVCVTGLIVVDTASYFTVWGQLVVLALIQIGGLGIMVLSFFAIFSIRKKISLEQKFLISYMVSDEDMSNLADNLKRIVYITLLIEGIGGLLLFIGFSARGGVNSGSLFNAVFHSVSAFCNAGFALFPDSLEGFGSSVYFNSVIAGLIILGGLSFIVISNILSVKFPFAAARHDERPWVNERKQTRKKPQISLNTRVVCTYTVILIVAGMLLVYILEHGNTMKAYSLGRQYLAAFFQSVTLRTAGFNTIPFSGLTTTTYLVMMVFMFIGGASGSTAGGLKVNTLGVLWGYISSQLRGKEKVLIHNYSIPDERVIKAFLILVFAVMVVTVGTVFLSITEAAPLEHIMFEVVSAFGTVGLSSGITAHLSGMGKCVIMLLMFMGRLGPLTILTALAKHGREVHIEYPQGIVNIG